MGDVVSLRSAGLRGGENKEENREEGCFHGLEFAAAGNKSCHPPVKGL